MLATTVEWAEVVAAAAVEREAVEGEVQGVVWVTKLVGTGLGD